MESPNCAGECNCPRDGNFEGPIQLRAFFFFCRARWKSNCKSFASGSRSTSGRAAPVCRRRSLIRSWRPRRRRSTSWRAVRERSAPPGQQLDCKIVVALLRPAAGTPPAQLPAGEPRPRLAAQLPSCRRRDAWCRFTILLSSLAAAAARAVCFMSMTLAPILISRASFVTNFLRVTLSSSRWPKAD